MSAELVDDPQLAGLMVREAWRRLRRGLRAPTLPSFALVNAAPERLLMAPHPFRRGEPALAEDLYCGRFAFAGHVVETSRVSPFELRDAPDVWQCELHSFEWLRHLSEAGDALAGANARAFIIDLLAMPRRRWHAAARRPEIVARRLVAFLTNAPLILAGSDALFERTFLAAIGREARLLRRIAPEVRDGMPRLEVRIALAFAALCLPGSVGAVRAAAANLAADLDRHIHADGGPTSRNPDHLASLLAKLLPLRQCFAARQQPMPRGLYGAIDRMLPALRFFRHPDGSLALFNGGTGSEPPLVSALLRHDETLGEPISHMRQSGYQRLVQNGTTVIVDAGSGPPRPLSGEAHAGTLAFEFSSNRHRFVVNCGSPQGAGHPWRRVARATAAHSTLTIADRSSSRFARTPIVDRFLGGPIVAGPERVPASREDDATGQRLVAAHDGYRDAFGLVHEREIVLSRDGTTLEGCDRLHSAGTAICHRTAQPPEAMLRFHLHPDVEADAAGTGIRLFAGGEVWWFFADAPLALEPSIFFADATGPRRTFQVAVSWEGRREAINWRFERRF